MTNSPVFVQSSIVSLRWLDLTTDSQLPIRIISVFFRFVLFATLPVYCSSKSVLWPSTWKGDDQNAWLSFLLEVLIKIVDEIPSS